MKLLVIGSDSTFGNAVAMYLAEHQHDVYAFAEQVNPFERTRIINYSDLEVIERDLLNESYDAVVDCAAVLIKEGEANEKKAKFINSFFPHWLTETCKTLPTKIIYRGTDCIFSGARGGYVECDSGDAKDVYGRTKAEGELKDGKNLTFRTSIIGPDYKAEGNDLLNWFLKQRGEIQGYTKAFWTGVTPFVFARAAEAAIQQNITGIVNLVNDVKISKYDLLQIFNHVFRENFIHVIPSAKMNVDKSLIKTRHDFIFEVPSYYEMVNEIKQWCLVHPDIYPQFYYTLEDVQ